MNAQDLDKAYQKKKTLLRERGNLSLRHLEDVWHRRTAGRYIGDVIFGANDGIITTFAVVAGATGGHLDATVVIILGLANLFADGLSMGLGNYLGQKSERDYARGQRKKELWEIDNLPEIETQEIQEIFYKWGFRDADLARAVSIIQKDKNVWTDIMMKYELEIYEAPVGSPLKKGAATFVAFAMAGFVPLLPYILHLPGPFWWAVGLTAVELFAIGAARARLTPITWLKAGLEMLAIGAIAALAAYGIGNLLQAIL
ncbi:MAG: VIT1/CCC1 transporter family protein [Patescibacteria group bacterium]